MGYQARPDLFPVEQTYSLLREARPGVLISFGSGVTGNEDFISLDGDAIDMEPGDKPVEITHDLVTSRETPLGSTSQPARLVAALRTASDRNANLLVRVELRPDGSLDPVDQLTLREFELLEGRLGRDG